MLEDAHEVYDAISFTRRNRSLNPCCVGRCSRRQDLLEAIRNYCNVLILVVLEDAHEEIKITNYNTKAIVLILVVLEDAHEVISIWQ